jgi:hypothetical protein
MQSFTEMFKKNNWMTFIFIAVVAYALVVVYQYLSDRGVVGYEGNTTMSEVMQTPHPISSSPAGNFGHIDDVQNGATTSTIKNVEDLLPQDNNKQWNDLNPVGSNPLNGVNLLDAGHHIGTISQVKRNMNLQIRPEPTIPVVNTGPWNNTTIQENDHNNQLGYRALQ